MGGEPTEQGQQRAPLGAVSAGEDGVRATSVAAPTVVTRGAGEHEAQPVAPVAPPPAEPVNEVEGEDDFEALLAMSEAGASEERSFSQGDKVTGRVEVISLRGEEVFLDLGGKATGYILKEELRDDDGNLTVSQGELLEGIVASVDAHGVRIRTSLVAGAGDRRALVDAFEAGLPVEAKVTGVNKGGFEVTVAGANGFCPMSQIDLYRPPEPEVFIGRTLTFKITELRDGSPVLSRQALLKEEREKKAIEVRKNLAPGARLEGVVRSIQKFGAFVDLGGVDGLVHISELSWSRVEDPHTIVSLGDKVEVVVLEVDEKADRIALSLRKAGGDPFEEALGAFQVGDVVDGSVVRLTNFGAFVNLAPHVDGLIHLSDMAHYHVRSARDVLAKGDSVRVKVMGVDVERRRISLSLKALAEDPWSDIDSRYKPGQVVKGMVARIQDFGVFVDLEPGVTALLPASESGVAQGQPLGSRFRPGKELEAKVLRVNGQDRRLALTMRDDAEQRSFDRGHSGPGRGGRPDRGRGRGPGGRDRDRGPRQMQWRDEPTKKKSSDGKEIGSFGELLLQALGSDDDSKDK